MENVNKILSENIKNARLKKMMPKSVLAEGANLAYHTMVKIEANRKSTTVLEMVKIAKTLNVDVESLLEGII